MFERLRDLGERLKLWWEELGEDAPSESKVLAFFRPREPTEVPRSLKQVAAVGAVAALFALGGVALLSLSALLLALFAIYFLVTEVLGLELEIDPRLWQML